MYPQILGISGSSIKNSDTDRLVLSGLAASGLKSEFVKLSRLNVRPCLACLGCTEDNVCKVEDDFPELAEKVRHAGALAVGREIAARLKGRLAM
jgi:multimeric flavodoxin WrbA